MNIKLGHQSLSYGLRSIYPTITTLLGSLFLRDRFAIFLKRIRAVVAKVRSSAKILDLIFRQRVFHVADSVLHSSNFIDLLGHTVRVLVVILFFCHFFAYEWLFQVDQLRFQVGIMLVVDHWLRFLQIRSRYSFIAKRLAVGVNILVVVGLCESFLSFFDALLSLQLLS